MKIPPITPAIGPERISPTVAEARQGSSTPTAAPSNSQPAAGGSLLAQVITVQSATAAAEVRLFRSGETLLLESKTPPEGKVPLASKAALPSSVALQVGQIISVKPVAGGYQIDQSGPAINHYLLRLLLPRDAALQRPIAEMQRWQSTTLTAATPALVTAGLTNSLGALATPPFMRIAAQRATMRSDTDGADIKSATSNLVATTTTTQRPPVSEATMALVRALINNIPQRGQLNANAIREFVSQATLLPGAAARPGLHTLLLQIAQSLTPGDLAVAGAVSGGRPLSGTHLRKPVADMLGKLLLNQLQPLMQRLEATDSEMRRVDLLVRNDPQLDTFSLQFSRTDLPTTRINQEETNTADQAALEKTRAWRVTLTFHLQRLGEVSAIVNYTEGQSLSTSIWSDSAGTFALMRKHQSQLQERLALTLQDSGIDIQVDIRQGKPSAATRHLSSHLVDTRA